jgi:hypothetical protein
VVAEVVPSLQATEPVGAAGALAAGALVEGVVDPVLVEVVFDLSTPP